MASLFRILHESAKVRQEIIELLISPPRGSGSAWNPGDRDGKSEVGGSSVSKRRATEALSAAVSIFGIWGCERYRKTTKAYAVHSWPLACVPLALHMHRHR
jgi:hypothetical protein